MTNRDIVKLHNIKNDVDRMYEEGANTLGELSGHQMKLVNVKFRRKIGHS